MLAAGADAFLSVAGAGEAAERVVGVDGAEEDRLELVHAGVGEEEGGVIDGDDGGGGPVVVGLGFEEADEGVTDEAGGPGWGIGRCRHRRRGRSESGGSGQQNPTG